MSTPSRLLPVVRRVLVCGGRDYNDKARMKQELDAIYAEVDEMAVIEGGAKGADWLAYSWCLSRFTNVQHEQFEADWGRYGKAAGHIRNQQMLDEGKPDLVLAFPGGRGTADMVRRARKAGIEVREVE